MNNILEVKSLNISEKKGTIKVPRPAIHFFEEGIKEDAHQGKWHRQVSLLGTDSIEKFEKELGRKINFGEFAENLTTEGLPVYKTHPLDRFVSGEIELEVTQIGKKCHGTSCVIYRETGNCVMPKEGIFCRVIKGGEMKTGDKLEYFPKVFKVKVITLSDRAFNGVYTDKSGPKITEISRKWFTKKELKCEFENLIVPDEPDELANAMLDGFNEECDIIFTTGSTGIGDRDIAIETIQPMLDKEIPGIMELIRVKYGLEKPNALLSRGIAGVKNKTLVFAMPGSPKAIAEYLEEINKVLWHSFLMLHGIDSH
jgi:molybdenum cofactor synthesis domain-containing protein